MKNIDTKANQLKSKQFVIKKKGRPVGPNHRTIVMLVRNDRGGWKLSRWKGNLIQPKNFHTQAEAREFAAEKNWGIKRLPNHDFAA